MTTLTWNSSINELYRSKASKTADKLASAGLMTLADLLWLFPLKIQQIPQVENFEYATLDTLFRGKGTIVSVRARPSFTKGKRGARLLNITAIVQDDYSAQTLTLQWFNTYSSMAKKLESLKEVIFLGQITEYKGQYQIVSPQIYDAHETPDDEDDFIIQYPTVNGVGPAQIKKVIQKIPSQLWDNIADPLEDSLRIERGFIELKTAFQCLHGKLDKHALDDETLDKAKKRLIYHEFYLEQIKIFIRRKVKVKVDAPIIEVDKNTKQDYLSLFPYELTEDQIKCLSDIEDDLKIGHPMARLIQGDVGSGKTTVAIITALMAIKNGFQASLMCPTESLAVQHFQTIQELLGKQYNIRLLIGSTKAKERREIQEGLDNNEIQFLIGTHALFQDSLSFANLGLAIIDEQHKFGVEQRLKLINKGKGCHSIIMTATPIPRSLSLTQYGDLDVSVIKSMPKGRKGIQTRIVPPSNFEKFLTFINTRISLGEQAYIVVPAIEENETTDIMALETVYTKFKKIFSHLNVDFLHGKMKPEEKSEVFLKFGAGNINILIATSVVEVGINVPNATIMAIINPERFGLSSLHQLRGRVGRGTKPGFCFLVLDQSAKNSIERLQKFEGTTDGFEIAEADLEIRGEGDLLGVHQSGSITTRKLANIVRDQDILQLARKDIEALVNNKNPAVEMYMKKFSQEDIITSSI